jgi:hypothetical protein
MAFSWRIAPIPAQPQWLNGGTTYRESEAGKTLRSEPEVRGGRDRNPWRWSENERMAAGRNRWPRRTEISGRIQPKSQSGRARNMHMLAVVSRACHILRDLQDRPVSPEWLAVLALWAQVFHLLDACRVSMQAFSSFSLHVVNRMAMETMLTAAVVQGEGEVAKSLLYEYPNDQFLPLKLYAHFCLMK